MTLRIARTNRGASRRGSRPPRRVALRRPLAVLAALVLLALPALVHVERAVAVANTWSAAGPLATARYGHTGTLLPNGKVLVAGGYGGAGALASAELYDPVANTWSASGPLATARYLHTATLLPNGKVLVAGGIGAGVALASAELYDPATNTWSAAAPLATARYHHTATLLPNGKVLVAGGDGGGGALASAELYDPATNTWSAAAPLATARYYHTATLLPNGKVLVAGGIGASGAAIASAELYDPATNTWSAAGSLATARRGHTATLLPNGKVLAAGGQALASGELYDPFANTWSAAGSLATARYWHTATLLANGKVLAAGGVVDPGVALASAELYEPTPAPAVPPPLPADTLLARTEAGFEVMNVNGGARSTIYSGTPMSGVVNEAGTRVAFWDFIGGQQDVFAMNVDGSGVTNLTNDPDPDSSPSYSPDGTKLLFSSYRSSNEEIYVMNEDGTGEVQLTFSSGFDLEPRYSPDGSKIVFRSQRDDNAGDIYVMNANGTGVVRLTTYVGIDALPDWSPDGTRIAFMSNRSGSVQVWVMNADGTNQVLLTTEGSYNSMPSWSRDGSWIAYSRDGDLWLITPDGASTHRVTNTPSVTEWYPDWVKPADYDGDGLADSVDLSPFSFSDDFSDGTTSGSIADRNGCYVSVVDSPYPAPNDGVLIGNVCPPSEGGPATIAVSCPDAPGTLTIPDGGLIVGTCGSFYYGTISGKTYFTFQSFYNGVLRETVLTEDPGETAVVADNGDGSYSVINTSLNGGPITVTYGPYTVTMPPDTACIVEVLPSGEFQVTNATQTSAPAITVNDGATSQPVQRDQTVTLPPPAVGGISETPDVSTLPSVASAPGGRNTLWVVSAALALAGLAMVAGWKLRRRLSAS